MKTVEERMRERIGEVEKPDRDQRFRDMLDECYSFKGVGGPFEHMLPSCVLEEMDPVAFRCGVNDFEDSDDTLEEFDGEYYDKVALSELREECQTEFDEDEEAAAEARADQLRDDIADKERENDT